MQKERYVISNSESWEYGEVTTVQVERALEDGSIAASCDESGAVQKKVVQRNFCVNSVPSLCFRLSPYVRQTDCVQSGVVV